MMMDIVETKYLNPINKNTTLYFEIKDFDDFCYEFKDA